MTRRLLPYEHDLIEALGVTKAEYLEFLALQKQYSDPKQDTQLDIRNEAGTVALVLTIVGTLAQVAAALLTPRPQIPTISSGQRQTREQRTAPRFGFNSIQELARYGDVIPLIYTSITDNKEGAVRVATQLLWSAVQSLGTKQFVRLQLLLGAGAITQINPEKSAFGQVPVRDLISTNAWIYFNSGSTQTLSFGNSIKGTPADDPTYSGLTTSPYGVEKSIADKTKTPGFSHAYTPSSANKFGIYAAVPINVFVYARASNDSKNKTLLNITVGGLTGYAGAQFLQLIPQDEVFTLTIAKTTTAAGSASFIAAQNARNGYAANFDEAGLFKLGSGIFRVTKVTGVTTDQGNVTVELKRIGTDPAYSPTTPYNATSAADVDATYKKSDILIASKTYINLKTAVEKLLDSDDRNAAYEDLESNLKIPGYTQVISVDDLYAVKDLWTIQYQTTKTKSGEEIDYSSPTGWKKRKLTAGELKNIKRYLDLTKSIVLEGNDLFYTKALVRYEVASYETLQACHAVDLSIKAIVYREISGRQAGIKYRSAMFILRYKQSGTSTWNHVPGIFVVRRNNQSENYLNIRFNSNQADAKNWTFELEPISDPRAEALTRNLRSGGKIQYFYLENSNKAVTVSLPNTSYNVQFYGYTYASTNDYPLNTGSPRATNEWDLFSLDADTNYTLSMDRGPEFTLLCVTEHILTPTNTAELYKNMSLVGFNAFSSKGLQDLRSFTALVEKGRPVYRIKTDGTAGNYYDTTKAPSSYAPDIFLDTILDATDGIGKYAPAEAIDFDSLVLAKKFCVKNELFFDGVIADPGSWREFWATVAPYSLLEFGRMNGKETLVPAVPYNSDGTISSTVTVSALFNQGNILEDSYKEEFLDFGSGVQDLIATVIYRSTDSDGIFARNKSVNIQLKDVVDADAVRQTFDLSAYVSNRTQAIKYGKLLCNIRRHVRSAIEFRTFPNTTYISPGTFIYVDVGQNSWNNVQSGVVGPGGVLNMPVETTMATGTKTFLLYQSGKGLQSGQYSVTKSGDTFVAADLSSKEGYLFVMGTTETKRRVFRVTEVDMSEEGEVTVRASSYPCDPAGAALIADFSDGLFTVTG